MNKVYLLIHLSDSTGYPIWQSEVKGIYSSKDDAERALNEANENMPEDGGYGCDYSEEYYIEERDVIHPSSNSQLVYQTDLSRNIDCYRNETDQ